MASSAASPARSSPPSSSPRSWSTRWPSAWPSPCGPPRSATKQRPRRPSRRRGHAADRRPGPRLVDHLGRRRPAPPSMPVLVLALVGAGGLRARALSPGSSPWRSAACSWCTALTDPNPTLHAERTFFGVHRVFEDDQGRHVLANGTTTHGLQDPADPGTPLGYYHPDGPIGDVFTTAEDAPPRDVAVVGLGSGALAAYGRPGDTFTYYEIDPAVADIASDPSLFTYLVGQRGHDGHRPRRRPALARAHRRRLRPARARRLQLRRHPGPPADRRGRPGVPAPPDARTGCWPSTSRTGTSTSPRSSAAWPTTLGLTGLRRIDPSSPELEAAGRWSTQWVVLAADPSAVSRLTPETGLGRPPAGRGPSLDRRLLGPAGRLPALDPQRTPTLTHPRGVGCRRRSSGTFDSHAAW